MEKNRTVPTLAQDIRAVADLYVDLARLMARRLTHPSRWDRYQFYAPLEIVRRNAETEREELVRS
ncbi:MAG: hypothetical protein IH957_06850 [Chloroflexi bacterium]|nr:hypothetical protein [Chloroflexota bacterium]